MTLNKVEILLICVCRNFLLTKIKNDKFKTINVIEIKNILYCTCLIKEQQQILHVQIYLTFFFIYFHLKSTKYCFKNRTRNRARRAPTLPTISPVSDYREVTLVFHQTRHELSKAYSKPVTTFTLLHFLCSFRTRVFVLGKHKQPSAM